MLERCPWCGKISSHNSTLQCKKKNTPLLFKFYRCEHCYNYYGQPLYSKTLQCCFIAGVVLIICSFVFQNIYIAFISIVPALIAFFSPVKKMDANENEIIESGSSLQGVVLNATSSIEKNKLYFFSEDFDDHKSFSLISPIIISSAVKGSNVVEFYFLYDHPANLEYISTPVFLFDERMNKVATFQIFKP